MDTGGPLINYDLVIISLPTLLLGAIIGVKINGILPSALLCVFLVLVLLMSLKRTVLKAHSLWKLEGKKNDIEGVNLKKLPKLSSEIFKNNEDLLKIYMNSCRFFPFQKFLKIIFFVSILIMITLFKGSKKVNSIIKIKTCSWAYWIFDILSFLICVLAFRKYSGDILKVEEDKIRNNYYEYCNMTNPVLKEKIYKISKSAFLAGILGGMLGLGGGYYILNSFSFVIYLYFFL